jgi:SAM-dependent methyltransferase
MEAQPIGQQVANVDELKATARKTWALGNFGDLAAVSTVTAAPELVRFASVRAGHKVLDVGTGTGVVAITARHVGAVVTGADLTPELLEQARANAKVASYPDIRWDVADVEALPYGDASFDVVLSQFGHMFAPRPDVTTREMLRVLKPGGTIAFSTWPWGGGVHKQFGLLAKYLPAPSSAPSPLEWGDPRIVSQRLGSKVKGIEHSKADLLTPGLSVPHLRTLFEMKGGPTIRALQALERDPEKLAAWRNEVEVILREQWKHNVLRQEYLLTRATKIA